MKTGKLLLIIGVVTTMFYSCDNQPKLEVNEGINLADSISYYEKSLFGDNSKKIDRNDAVKLAGFYESYALENKQDTLAPYYLFKSADINMNMRRPRAAIKSFDIILKDYPDFEKAPSALFLKAFVFEDQLGDIVSASRFYRLFIEKYPDSDFADDAAISLKYLGKTPEELIEEFEKNN